MNTPCFYSRLDGYINKKSRTYARDSIKTMSINYGLLCL